MIVRTEWLRQQGYARPIDSFDAFQAIDESEYVRCSGCGKMVGYVHGYVALGHPRIQLCGDCSFALDGKPVFKDQEK